MKVNMPIAITAQQNKHWKMLQSKSTNQLTKEKSPYLFFSIFPKPLIVYIVICY